jgi:hypothetical protein
MLSSTVGPQLPAVSGIRKAAGLLFSSDGQRSKKGRFPKEAAFCIAKTAVVDLLVAGQLAVLQQVAEGLAVD